MSFETKSRPTPAERCKRQIELSSARIEAYLSTHAFEILFTMIYILANVVKFAWGAHGEYHFIRNTYERENPGHVGFKWFIAIARGAGYSLNLNCGLVIILGCRMLITKIRESPLHKVLPLDKAFPLAHILVAYGIALGVAIHVPFHLIWLIRYNQWDGFRLWSYTWTVAMGAILLAVFAIMFVFALPRMREKYFHIFYMVHLTGATLFFILVILHGMYRKVPETYRWVAPGLILYTIDRIYRRFKVKHAIINFQCKHATLISSSNVIKLQFKKPFNYRAGQYAEICIPCIEKTKEWHPFTIASSSLESEMVFYIKKSGDWTSRLEQTIKNGESFMMKIRGPFGAPAQHVGNYRRVILISGGIGSTPFYAICKDLYYGSKLTQPSCTQGIKSREAAARKLIDSPANRNLTKVISSLYSVEGAHIELLSQQANFAADTINLATSNENVINTRTEAGETQSSESEISTIGDVEKGITHVRSDILSELQTYRARLTSFLHSTRVLLFLLLTVVVRIGVLCVVAILQDGVYWACLADAFLSIILAVMMAATIGLELSYMKWHYFKRSDRVIDFLAFLPLSLLTAYLSIRDFPHSDMYSTRTLVKFAWVLPVLLILLISRMYRSIGSHKMLEKISSECGCKCAEKVPDVDFVWCTSTNKDDEWLRNDLEPLAQGSELRLHRYVTREDPDVPSTSGERRITMTRGRPNWESFFATVASRTTSRTDVGVFFCGPPRMGKDIKKALHTVEAFCNVRGAYLNALRDQELADEFRISQPEEIDHIKGFGSNVRFVFREENF